MSASEAYAFPDRETPPTDELLVARLGGRKQLWDDLLSSLQQSHKEISWSWNYYNDGHQWLFKLVQKKKTILWGAVLTTGDFRITFYFGDKAGAEIESSNLPQKMKDAFRGGRRYGKIRAITSLVRTRQDLENVLKVAALKVRLK